MIYAEVRNSLFMLNDLSRIFQAQKLASRSHDCVVYFCPMHKSLKLFGWGYIAPTVRASRASYYSIANS